MTVDTRGISKVYIQRLNLSMIIGAVPVFLLNLDKEESALM